MRPRILSVNLGAAEPDGPKGVPTGIAKRPVEVIAVRAPGPKAGGLGSGVVEDFIGDREHHGGDRQALYAVAREELDWWAHELRRELPDGMFGENLTTTGIDVDAAIVGSRWRVGTAVLQVTDPRIPCITFARRMNEPRWVKRFTDHGRSGAYLAVLEPGEIRAGDLVEVTDVPPVGESVAQAFAAATGR